MVAMKVEGYSKAELCPDRQAQDESQQNVFPTTLDVKHWVKRNLKEKNVRLTLWICSKANLVERTFDWTIEMNPIQM